MKPLHNNIYPQYNDKIQTKVIKYKNQISNLYYHNNKPTNNVK